MSSASSLPGRQRDGLITRTATYAIVTAVLVTLYVVVTVVPATLVTLESDLLVAGATLAMAASAQAARGAAANAGSSSERDNRTSRLLTQGRLRRCRSRNQGSGREFGSDGDRASRSPLLRL